MIIEYQEADSALEQLNAESNDKYFWEGWTICKFSPSSAAFYESNGVYDKDKGWGFVTKYDLDSSGRWTVDH